MKNKKNKENWVEKVKYTLELWGKSNRTFDNYKSHITRFLNYYGENIEINKLLNIRLSYFYNINKTEKY